MEDAVMYPIQKSAVMSLFLLIVLFTAGTVYADDWGRISDAEWAQEAPPDYPEANAVILFDRGELEVRTEVIKFSRHVRIKILTRAGVEEESEISIRYDSDDNFKDLKAQAITPDGKKHKVGRKDRHVKTQGSREVTSFAFPAVEEGCIVEYKYSYTNNSYGSLEPWYFQSNLYTLQSEFTLALDAGFLYSTSFMNVPLQNRQAVKDSSSTVTDLPVTYYTWKLENLPPIKDEPFMAFVDNYRASIRNQLVEYVNPYSGQSTPFIEGWADMAETMEGVIDDYTDGGKILENIVDSLTVDSIGKIELAGRIYNYVAENYVSKADRYYLSHDKLSEMINDGFGTRDEKNVLLTELLKVAGIEAWPVLIGTRDYAKFMPEIYQLHQFNHVISMALIDNRYYYLDAWLRSVPFGYLPPDSRTEGGLRLAGKNSGLVKINSDAPKSSRSDFTFIDLDSQGLATCSTSVDCRGYYAALYEEILYKTKESDFIEEDILSGIDEGLEVTSFDISYPDPGQMKINIHYTVDDLATVIDNTCFVKPLSLYFYENPFKSERRFFPIDFNFPFRYQNVCQVNLKDSVVAEELPPPITASIDGAQYQRNCMFDGKKVLVNSQLYVAKSIFDQSLYREVKGFFDTVVGSANDEISFGMTE